MADANCDLIVTSAWIFVDLFKQAKNNKNLNASTLWERKLVKLATGCVGKEEVIFVRPAELCDNQVETVSLKESEAARLRWGLRKEGYTMLS